MTNKYNRVIYIGVTNNIEEREKEHKLKIYPRSFTARYNCNKLVYIEEYDNVEESSKREKQFKKWNRAWKLNLIKEANPSWSDISQNWKFDFTRTR